MRAFRSLGEVANLVERFEDCTLPVQSWDHAAHLAMAIWCMLHDEEYRATERFIRAVRRYHRVNGLRIRRVGGYHETLTLSWLAIARRYLRRRSRGVPVLGVINGFVRQYGAREALVFEHYRKETLRSYEARFFWVEPDLKPLD